jgi:hypothetical protein
MLAWCGGAASNLVDDYAEERTRLATIGATVLTTGLFAAVSSAYAVSTVFGDGPWVPALALLWGATIFNIDRLIVMTMHGGTLRRLITAIPRLALATVIAFVIARPLELWIFSPEIARGLMLSEADARKTANAEWAKAVIEADQRYGVAVAEAGIAAGMPVYQAKLDTARRDVSDCEARAKEKEDAHKAEADGSGGSKDKGDGPIAKLKRGYYIEARRLCDAAAKVAADARTAVDRALERQAEATKGHAAAREQDIGKATASLQEKLDGLKATPAGSLLARHQQLGHLGEIDAAVWWMTSFLTALFWLIESLPVLAKLMAGESIYDSRIKDRRDAALAASKGAHSALTAHEAAGQHAAKLAAQVRHAEGEEAAATQRAAMELRYAARRSVIDAARERWQPPEVAVSDALSGLERDARFPFRDVQVTVEPPVPEPQRENRSRRQLILGGSYVGITAAAIVVAFYVLPHVGLIAKSNLNMALTVGSIVVGLIALKSRVSRTKLEETE